MQRAYLKLLGMVILALGIVLVVIQNRQPMEVSILFFSFVAPAALILFATAAVGFLLGLTAAFFILRRRKDQEPRLRRPE